MSEEVGEGKQEIVRRLDAVISLLMETSCKNEVTLPMSTRIKLLHRAGLRPVEIGRILGKKITYVNKEISLLRKRGES